MVAELVVEDLRISRSSGLSSNILRSYIKKAAIPFLAKSKSPVMPFFAFVLLLTLHQLGHTSTLSDADSDRTIAML